MLRRKAKNINTLTNYFKNLIKLYPYNIFLKVDRKKEKENKYR